MKNYYVYCYLNPLKPGFYAFSSLSFPYEPFYIGYGKDDRRFYHIKEAKRKTNARSNLHKINTINKILRNGEEPIIEILYQNLSHEEAQKLERSTIASVGRSDLEKGPLTNLTDGGDGLHNPSDDTRKKIGDRPYKTGSDNHFYGINAWDTYNRVCSPETRKKLSRPGKQNPMYGSHHTEEWRETHSQRMSGSGNPNFGGNFGMKGKSHSEETKKKQSQKARKVPCTIDGIEYPSYKAASVALGISYDTARYRAKREAPQDT